MGGGGGGVRPNTMQLAAGFRTRYQPARLCVQTASGSAGRKCSLFAADRDTPSGPWSVRRSTQTGTCQSLAAAPPSIFYRLDSVRGRRQLSMQRRFTWFPWCQVVRNSTETHNMYDTEAKSFSSCFLTCPPFISYEEATFFNWVRKKRLPSVIN